MTSYQFFAAQLRFVANRAGCESGDVARKVDALFAFIDEVDSGNEKIFIAEKDLRSTSRALAGVAGFLQQHILPEVIADQNAVGEKQLRWTIETCMTIMANLLTHAELTKDAEGIFITLPPLD